MKRLRVLRLAAGVIALAVACSGCAVFYTQDVTYQDGSTERECGLLGGCLPIWNYTSRKNVPTANERQGGRPTGVRHVQAVEPTSRTDTSSRSASQP